MNSRYKKILSLLMAFALILQFSVTLTAFAEDTNEGSDAALAVEETSKDEKEEQAKSNEEKKDTASEESTAEEAENKSEGEEASESEKSDQADDEDQSEEPGDTDTQDASAANATVSDNALAAANDDDETITITVHPSSREGIDFAETVVIKAKKGSTYNDIKDQIPAMNNIPGYKTYAAWQMKKPLSEATSESDALDSRFTGNEVLTENTDVYYPLSKMFNGEITVTPPVCGTSAATEMPEFTLAEGSNNGYASTNHNVWCGGARNPVQYTGDIKGGNKYYMYIVFLLDWGYYGDSQSNVTVNNATFEYLWMGFSDRIGFIASVEADHDWDDGVVTKEPTCTEPGTKTLSCKHNGEDWHDADATKENVEIPATGHDWGDWVVTKEATVDEEGEETRTCKVCGETETRPIPKLDPDSDSDSDSDQDSHADSSSDTYDSDSDTDSTDDTSSKKDSKSPETGDETDISLWLTLMAVSFATMAAVARDSRKKNNEK